MKYYRVLSLIFYLACGESEEPQESGYRLTSGSIDGVDVKDWASPSLFLKFYSDKKIKFAISATRVTDPGTTPIVVQNEMIINRTTDSGRYAAFSGSTTDETIKAYGSAIRPKVSGDNPPEEITATGKGVLPFYVKGKIGTL